MCKNEQAHFLFWVTGFLLTVLCLHNGMLRHAYGRPVIFISLQTYVAPVLHKIPVLPPEEGGRQEKGILRNTGAT